MGLVFGKIIDTVPDFGYQFLKAYCIQKNISFDDYPDDKLILTRTIETLKVIKANGVEITGIGNQISGMDSDGFEISIEGIPYPFYEEEFPQYVKAYRERFE
ncbi:MAG: hypothetical protein IPG07_06665 [Crocinitomicaceae bacterium]|nr:hypothetical protein [Crocinitomicaceae bacterium]